MTEGQSTPLVPDPKVKRVFRATSSATWNSGDVHRDFISPSQPSCGLLSQAEVVLMEVLGLFFSQIQVKKGLVPTLNQLGCWGSGWPLSAASVTRRKLGEALCWAHVWSYRQICGLGTEMSCLFGGSLCRCSCLWHFHCEMMFSRFSLKP